jgi:hypothetical protein
VIATQNVPMWQKPAAPDRRPLLIFALILVSVSGLITGISLRPLTHGSLFDFLKPPTNAMGAPPVTTVATATPTPVATTKPESFHVYVDLSNSVVASGNTVTLIANTNLDANSQAAVGITCTVAISGPSTLPKLAAQSTDGNGKTSWTITVPPGAAAGAYHINVNADWSQGYRAWSTTVLTVTVP